MDLGDFKGRKITAFSVSNQHMLVICVDGTLLSWGYGYLGDGSSRSEVSYRGPVQVNAKGLLKGKTITAIQA
ncbi:hypothetical protein, partial [Mycobacterium tuberculosis]